MVLFATTLFLAMERSPAGRPAARTHKGPDGDAGPLWELPSEKLSLNGRLEYIMSSVTPARQTTMQGFRTSNKKPSMKPEYSEASDRICISGRKAFWIAEGNHFWMHLP